MNNITFSHSLRKQLHNPEAYLEQTENVLSGLFRVFCWWVRITTAYTSAAVIFLFITQDLSAYSQVDLQEGLRVIVILTSGIAALAAFFSNAGRFRNVFSDRARDEIERFQAIKEKVESQIDIAKSELVKHGLGGK